MKTIITYGTFDYFHYGHYNFLKQAKEKGDYLIVGVSTDACCFKKGKIPLLNENQRFEIISNLKFVDKVIFEYDMNQKIEDIDKYNVDILFEGEDYKEIFPKSDIYDKVNQKCEICYAKRTPEISTTLIKNKLISQLELDKDKTTLRNRTNQIVLDIKEERKVNMKYIIMCGGTYVQFKTPRQLLKVNNERLVDRTIRLLKENGISDIAISTQCDAFNDCGVEIIKDLNNKYHSRSYNNYDGYWVDAFYKLNAPTCYLFGDVFYSPEAIKKIVDSQTDDVLFFANVLPFAKNYPKNHVEPLCYKVQNYIKFYDAIEKCKKLYDEGKFWRHPLSWDVWIVLKGFPTNYDYFRKWTEDIFGDNFIGIHDYSCDVDSPEDIEIIENCVFKDKKSFKKNIISNLMYSLERDNDLNEN